MEEIKAGDKYRHYKNKDHTYEIIGLAKHSETLEDMVVYKALYENKEFGYGVLWVRPKKMFLENVIVDNKEVKRFKKI
jgi:hypothetical protein